MGTTSSTDATARKYKRARKPRVYPLHIEEWADGGYFSYGHHDEASFITALSAHIDLPVETACGFSNDYGYNVPASHFSDYRTVWYPCDGPKRGAIPITCCYGVIIERSKEGEHQ